MTVEPTRQRLAVVIPCFNEAPSIKKVVEDFARVLPHAEIYVFDNRSTDATAQIAQEAGATVIFSPNQGKGNVIKHMSRVIDADVYMVAFDLSAYEIG